MAVGEVRTTEVEAETAASRNEVEVEDQNTVDFEEQQLTDASIAGCTESFEELYAHYYPKVRGFVLRKTGNPALAEDIAQEAFARAFERIGQFGGPKHFGGWVGTIAANLCTDHFRRKRNTEVSLETDSDRGPAYEVDPIRNIQRQDTGRLVRLALDKLEPRQREALLLHEVKGMTCAAVGDQLGISEVAAESLLARARRRLRKEITAKAAPADLFGVGGLGLLPALLRAWRHLREGASRRATNVQMATSRAFENMGGNLIPGVDGAKALVVVMGAALTIQVASAAAPPAEQAVVDPATAAATTSAPALIAADGDTSPGLASGVSVPVSGYVGADGRSAGLSGGASVDLPDPTGDETHNLLDVSVDGHVDVDEGVTLGTRIVVGDADEPLLDTGDLEIDTTE